MNKAIVFQEVLKSLTINLMEQMSNETPNRYQKNTPQRAATTKRSIQKGLKRVLNRLQVTLSTSQCSC